MPASFSFSLRTDVSPSTAYSLFAMHRQPELWGSDALEFNPDRFLDARVQRYLIKNPFMFLPFNAGPRICLGQQVCFPP